MRYMRFIRTATRGYDAPRLGRIRLASDVGWRESKTRRTATIRVGIDQGRADCIGYVACEGIRSVNRRR